MNHLRTAALVAAFAFSGCGNSNNEPAPDTGVDEADMATDGGADDVGASADGGADMSETACEPVFLAADDEPFDSLSEYCLFGGDPGAQAPGNGVVPFDPIAVLYADESLKKRFIALPPGEAITFDDRDRFTFPEGTTLVKTFFYYDDARSPEDGRRLLETRLIIKQNGEWEPYIYVWNDEQNDATFERLGSWVEFDRIDEAGETVATNYRVPNRNQCGSCHAQSDQLVPLGPRAFQLNEDYDYGGDVGVKNQLEHWEELGMFDVELPDVTTLFALTDYTNDGADLDLRARSYLEVNCAHCHSSEGAADPSGLKLSVFVTEPGEFGVCRRPVAAGAGSGGLFYDIVPGEADQSIMVYRMASTDPEIKMPELPTQTADDLGVELIREWIGAMEPAGCAE